MSGGYHNQLRWGGTIVLAVIVFGAAFWLGEDVTIAIPTEVFFLALGCGILGYLVTPYPSLVGALSVASIIILCVAGGFYTGRTIATTAFNDCVARGEMVRVLLRQFRTKHGVFPKDLGQLAHRNLPGQRWLRGPLLAYQRTPSGYEMSFSDWLVTHLATEKHGFAARK